MEMNIYYDEDGNPVDSERYFEIWRDRWQLTEDYAGIYVSTVYVGLDHSFMEKGPPLIYETMIFGGKFDDHQRHYATKEQAIAGHTNSCHMAIGLHVLVDGEWRPTLESSE